jgi:hypothetical protein
MAEAPIHWLTKLAVAKTLESLGYEVHIEFRRPNGGGIIDVHGVRGNETISFEIYNTHLSDRIRKDLPDYIIRILGKTSDREYTSYRTQCDKINQKDFKEDTKAYYSITPPQGHAQSQIQQQLDEFRHLLFMTIFEILSFDWSSGWNQKGVKELELIKELCETGVFNEESARVHITRAREARFIYKQKTDRYYYSRTDYEDITEAKGIITE